VDPGQTAQAGQAILAKTNARSPFHNCGLNGNMAVNGKRSVWVGVVLDSRMDWKAVSIDTTPNSYPELATLGVGG